MSAAVRVYIFFDQGINALSRRNRTDQEGEEKGEQKNVLNQSKPPLIYIKSIHGLFKNAKIEFYSGLQLDAAIQAKLASQYRLR